MSDIANAECSACDYSSCVASCKDKAALIGKMKAKDADVTKARDDLLVALCGLAQWHDTWIEGQDAEVASSSDEARTVSEALDAFEKARRE